MDEGLARLLQPLVSGVLLGGVYALTAVGLSLVWGVMKVVNIAHGVLALLGSYAALTLFQQLGLDPLLAAVLLAPAFFLFGLLLQRALVKPVLDKPEMNSLLVLFGLTIALENVITRVWTADFRTLTPAYSGTSFLLGGVNVSVARTITFVLSVAAVFGLHAILTRTYVGRAIRATAQNRSAALLAGVDADQIGLIAFGLGTALSALAGVALALIYSFYPSVHFFWIVKAFLIVVLGGVGNIYGTLAAALLLGVAETFFGTFVSFRWVDVSVYVLLLVILLVRPQGLYGKRA
ncbi:MAG: branched-chain amino acid ABC transporter permease [Chloroflexota bacterium]|nr:branched-chain amino acid ABC transporter permease [Chloroflexota bacterium]